MLPHSSIAISASLVGVTLLCRHLASTAETPDTQRAQSTRAATGLPSPSAVAVPESPLETEVDYVDNEILIQFDLATDATLQETLLRSIGGEIVETIRTKAMETFGHPPLVRTRTRTPVLEAVKTLKGRSGISLAEPNWICRIQSEPNDPFYRNNQLWALYSSNGSPKHSFGIGADTAWRRGKSGSRDVVVGIVDNGVFLSHPDLAPNMWVNPYDPVDGKDNDGNGYVDDTRGWDFLNDDNSVYDDPKENHGTHVAGTIGAVGGNGIGVVGVCPNVTMIPTKFVGKLGGTMANAVKALDYLTDLKLRHGINIVASNHSYGSVGFSVPLFYAIQRAAMAEILVVAAAGNGGNDGRGDNIERFPFYPGSYPLDNVITVAGIATNGKLMSMSNFSPNWVHLGAPGQRIFSTIPTSKGLPGYASLSGTSMATAMVTGAVALYAASRPSESTTAESLKAGVLRNTLINATLVGKTVTGGRLTVANY